MAHFAKVVDGIVIKVIVAEPEYMENWQDPDPQIGEWVQTSYNTKGGVHLLGGTPMRKNYAGIGYSYDKDLDAFIEPKPYESWVLDEESCVWKAPIEHPATGVYNWNEETGSWIKTQD
jgi:hypothetical protein